MILSSIAGRVLRRRPYMHTKNVSFHQQEHGRDLYASWYLCKEREYIHTKPHPDPKSYRASPDSPVVEEPIASNSLPPANTYPSLEASCSDPKAAQSILSHASRSGSAT
jgi:hypothetical protein